MATTNFITSAIPTEAMSVPTSPEQACQMARAINSSIINKLNSLGNKISALQRAVGSIANFAEVPTLPDLNNFLSVADLDLNQYRAIQAACPQLNLPAVNGLPSVPNLQQILQGALGNAIRNLDQSALGMLSALQGQFNGEIAALLAELAPITSLLNCLCQSATFATDIKPPQTASAISTYKYISGQTPEGVPNLLTAAQRDEVNNYQESRMAMRQLLTIPQ